MPWLFGYGSLIWRPGFAARAQRPACVRGWVRRFWQASPDHRGTVDAPGRVVTLVANPDGVVWGMAYLVSSAEAAEIFPGLDQREQAGYTLQTVDIQLAGRTSNTQALTYVGRPDNSSYLGELALDEIAAVVATSHGPSGSNTEYVLRLADAMREMGVEDTHVFGLEARIRSILGASARTTDPDRGR